MNKRYLLSFTVVLTLLVFVSNTASAQLRLGVKGGVDVINRKINLDIFKASNRLGFYVGPTLEFVVPLSGFGGEVSVLYGHKEYKIDDVQEDASLSSFNYISIPINVKQRVKVFGIGLFVSGGVYGNVKLEGGDIKNIKDSAGDVIEEYKKKNFIFGIGAGAGITLFHNIDLGLYFQGDLTKNYGYEYMDAGVFQNKKNQTWSVGLNYYF